MVKEGDAATQKAPDWALGNHLPREGQMGGPAAAGLPALGEKELPLKHLDLGEFKDPPQGTYKYNSDYMERIDTRKFGPILMEKVRKELEKR
jgi:hypothetical protein